MPIRTFFIAGTNGTTTQTIRVHTENYLHFQPIAYKGLRLKNQVVAPSEKPVAHECPHCGTVEMLPAWKKTD